MEIDFNNNKKQAEALKAVQSEKYNMILYGGAIRGGKTFWGLSTLLILCSVFPKSRWCVIRQNIEKIRTTTIPSFKKIEPSGTLKSSPYEYTHKNGSVILFKGENYANDKELNWMKGLEVNGVLFEEINECQLVTFNKAIERCGSWSVQGTQPNPIILATCNPTQGWVKQLIYDPWKIGNLRANWLYIPAKITDNIKNLDPRYVESLKDLPTYEYNVFVLGDWDTKLKTGGEFLKNFELSDHVRPVSINKEERIHISIDSNVLPYIAITAWQIEKNNDIWTFKQIHDIPARDPYNTARKAGVKLGKWLKSIHYNDRYIFLYGDPTTNARNNIDDNKKSFLDLFIEGLKSEGYESDKRFYKKAPNVASTGDFINAVLEGKIHNIKIVIGETCKESINDYLETKQDKDGGLSKKRVTDPISKLSYEEHGHLLDSFRYVFCKVFENEFNKFNNRFSDFTNYAIGKRGNDY